MCQFADLCSIARKLTDSTMSKQILSGLCKPRRGMPTNVHGSECARPIIHIPSESSDATRLAYLTRDSEPHGAERGVLRLRRLLCFTAYLPGQHPSGICSNNESNGGIRRRGDWTWSSRRAPFPYLEARPEVLFVSQGIKKVRSRLYQKNTVPLHTIVLIVLQKQNVLILGRTPFHLNINRGDRMMCYGKVGVFYSHFILLSPARACETYFVFLQDYNNQKEYLNFCQKAVETRLEGSMT